MDYRINAQGDFPAPITSSTIIITPIADNLMEETKDVTSVSYLQRLLRHRDPRIGVADESLMTIWR